MSDYLHKQFIQTFNSPPKRTKYNHQKICSSSKVPKQKNIIKSKESTKIFDNPKFNIFPKCYEDYNICTFNCDLDREQKTTNITKRKFIDLKKFSPKSCKSSQHRNLLFSKSTSKLSQKKINSGKLTIQNELISPVKSSKSISTKSFTQTNVKFKINAPVTIQNKRYIDNYQRRITIINRPKERSKCNIVEYYGYQCSQLDKRQKQKKRLRQFRVNGQIVKEKCQGDSQNKLNKGLHSDKSPQKCQKGFENSAACSKIRRVSKDFQQSQENVLSQQQKSLGEQKQNETLQKSHNHLKVIFKTSQSSLQNINDKNQQQKITNEKNRDIQQKLFQYYGEEFQRVKAERDYLRKHFIEHLDKKHAKQLPYKQFILIDVDHLKRKLILSAQKVPAFQYPIEQQIIDLKAHPNDKNEI